MPRDISILPVSCKGVLVGSWPVGCPVCFLEPLLALTIAGCDFQHLREKPCGGSLLGSALKVNLWDKVQLQEWIEGRPQGALGLGRPLGPAGPLYASRAIVGRQESAELSAFRSPAAMKREQGLVSKPVHSVCMLVCGCVHSRVCSCVLMNVHVCYGRTCIWVWAQCCVSTMSAFRWISIWW